MSRDTKYLKEYTDKQLYQAKKDAEDTIKKGKLIGRAEPYLNIIKDIDCELVKRLR